MSLTGLLHAPVLDQYWRTGHFVYMDEFYTDAKNGTLPEYAFVEPRLVYNHNDFHPPVGRVRESDVNGTDEFDSAISDEMGFTFDRDRDARDLFSVVKLDTPREPATWPTVHPAYVPPLQDEDEVEDLKSSPRPLTRRGARSVCCWPTPATPTPRTRRRTRMRTTSSPRMATVCSIPRSMTDRRID